MCVIITHALFEINYRQPTSFFIKVCLASCLICNRLPLMSYNFSAASILLVSTRALTRTSPVTSPLRSHISNIFVLRISRSPLWFSRMMSNPSLSKPRARPTSNQLSIGRRDSSLKSITVKIKCH